MDPFPYRLVPYMRSTRNLRFSDRFLPHKKMKAAIKRASEKGSSTQVVKKARSQTTTTSKKNVNRNYTSVNLGLGFPKRVVCTLKYAGYRDLTSGSGLHATYRYSCNGLYDPDITGTGHQPMYFDNLMAIYDHYTVIGSKLVLKVVPKSATQGPGAVAVFVNDSTSQTMQNVGNAFEQSSGTDVKLLAPGQSNPLVITKTWSAKRTFGGSVLGNDNLQGTAAANPTEQSYYDIVFQDLTTTPTSATVQIFVELEFTAVFDELKQQDQQ